MPRTNSIIPQQNRFVKRFSDFFRSCYPGTRRRRECARPAPGKRACRSSGGECEPGSLRHRRKAPLRMWGQQQKGKHPNGYFPFWSCIPGYSPKARMRAPCAGQASLPLFGRRMRTGLFARSAKHRSESGSESKKESTRMGTFLFGAATRIRTGALILTKDVLYQLSHSSARILL